MCFSDGAYTGYFLRALYPGKVKKLIAIGAGEWKQGFRTFDNTQQSPFQHEHLFQTTTHTNAGGKSVRRVVSIYE